jgi:prepilin-type processing-associated H-X9-DG protein
VPNASGQAGFARTGGVYDRYTTSWLLSILQYVEQGVLFNAFNLMVPLPSYNNYFGGTANRTANATLVNTYICPSENILNPWPALPDLWAPASYAGNLGGPGPISQNSGIIVPATETFQTLLGPGWCWNNGNNAYFGIASVLDGTTNTAMASEHLLGLAGSPPVLRASSNYKRTIFQPAMDLPPSVVDTGNAALALSFVASCQSIPGSQHDYPGASNGNGYTWMMTMPVFTMDVNYTHFMPPNGTPCTYASDPSGGYGGTWGAITANSNHPGGVNVGFADGSVKFIKDTIDLRTWWALGSRNIGEVVSADAY